MSIGKYLRKTTARKQLQNVGILQNFFDIELDLAPVFTDTYYYLSFLQCNAMRMKSDNIQEPTVLSTRSERPMKHFY